MTVVTIPTADERLSRSIEARRAPALRDVASIAGRALRAVPREAFAGFGYAIALKTGNPAAVNSSFLLFFPFLFMTSSYVPRNQLSGWLRTVAAWNPVTYVLEGQRSLVTTGWRWEALGQAALAIVAVGAISMSLCLAALRGRTQRG
jgi:ABC-2 type transport system permease protein